MATPADKTRPVKMAGNVTIRVTGSGKIHTRTLTYGTVSAKVAKADGKAVGKSVEIGKVLLRKAGNELMKPGVKLSSKRGVPLYHSDPDKPGLLVRRIDGRTERGVFKGGEFQVTE